MTRMANEYERADHYRVSIDYLHECFDYDPVRGLLTWRHRPRSHFKHSRQFGAVNTRFAGLPAGTLSPSGYLDVTIDGEKFRVHRVVWAMHTGAWPTRSLDHENRNKIDNRFVNLREASHSQNGANQPVSPRSKVGLKGVCAHNSRYRAQISAAGKVRYLGMFDTPELAHAAYCDAARLHHGEFAGGLCS
jgi:hypothetical protein